MKTVSINGLSLSGVDSRGCLFVVENLTGWGAPATTLQVTQRPAGNGGFGSPSFLQSRVIGVDGTVVGSSEALVEASLDALFAAVGLDPVLLTVNSGSGPRSMLVQQQDEILRDDISDVGHGTRWSMQVVALDPRKLGTPLTGATGLPSSTGGWTFPYTFPYTFNSTVVSGNVTLVNPGNADGPVLLRVNGPTSGAPLVGPVISHIGSAAQLVFSSDLTLGVGEWIDVDMDARTVLAQGQASRAQYVTSAGWSSFEPNQNVWHLTAVSGDPSSSLMVTATPAWR